MKRKQDSTRIVQRNCDLWMLQKWAHHSTMYTVNCDMICCRHPGWRFTKKLCHWQDWQVQVRMRFKPVFEDATLSKFCLSVGKTGECVCLPCCVDAVYLTVLLNPHRPWSRHHLTRSPTTQSFTFLNLFTISLWFDVYHSMPMHVV